MTSKFSTGKTGVLDYQTYDEALLPAQSIHSDTTVDTDTELDTAWILADTGDHHMDNY